MFRCSLIIGTAGLLHFRRTARINSRFGEPLHQRLPSQQLLSLLYTIFLMIEIISGNMSQTHLGLAWLLVSRGSPMSAANVSTAVETRLRGVSLSGEYARANRSALPSALQSRNLPAFQVAAWAHRSTIFIRLAVSPDQRISTASKSFSE